MNNVNGEFADIWFKESIKDFSCCKVLYDKDKQRSLYHLQQSVEKFTKGLYCQFNQAKDVDEPRKFGHDPTKIFESQINVIKEDLSTQAESLHTSLETADSSIKVKLDEFFKVIKIKNFEKLIKEKLPAYSEKLMSMNRTYKAITDKNIDENDYGKMKRQIQTITRQISMLNLDNQTIDIFTKKDKQKVMKLISQLTSDQSQIKKAEEFLSDKRKINSPIRICIILFQNLLLTYYLGIFTRKFESVTRYPLNNKSTMENLSENNAIIKILPDLIKLQKWNLELLKKKARLAKTFNEYLNQTEVIS